MICPFRGCGVELHPTNRNVFYHAHSSGGVWKTEDAGTKWDLVLPDATLKKVTGSSLASPLGRRGRGCSTGSGGPTTSKSRTSGGWRGSSAAAVWSSATGVSLLIRATTSSTNLNQ